MIAAYDAQAASDCVCPACSAWYTACMLRVCCVYAAWVLRVVRVTCLAQENKKIAASRVMVRLS